MLENQNIEWDMMEMHILLNYIRYQQHSEHDETKENESNVLPPGLHMLRTNKHPPVERHWPWSPALQRLRHPLEQVRHHLQRLQLRAV